MTPIMVAPLWLVVIGLFLWAIRVSYAVEAARRGGPREGLPRYTNLPSSLVRRDGDRPETVVLVGRLRRIMLGIVLLFAALAFVPILLLG